MEEGPSSTPPPPPTPPQTQQASAITHQDNALPSQPLEPPLELSAAQHVHHPHHYHHQSHSVRASFKRSQQATETEAEAVKPQATTSGQNENGAEGSDVVLVVEPDAGEKKKEEAETSLTTLPLPLSSNQEVVSGSGAGSSRTSEAPTHGGRLKEPLIEIPPTNGHPTPQQRGSKACCFCWCCCCSCSWKDTRCLTEKNNEENNARTMSAAPASAKENNILDILNGDNNEPPPTIEDIRMWGESFDKLMKCKGGRKVFRDFLRCEYSEENILFWLACEDIKREKNPEALDEKARLIYEDYISILSPKEVSLDSRVREIVNFNMREPSSHTFDEAQLQIYTLMHRDSYPRFVNSPMYKKLAQYNTSSRKESSA